MAKKQKSRRTRVNRARNDTTNRMMKKGINMAHRKRVDIPPPP